MYPSARPSFSYWTAKVQNAAGNWRFRRIVLKLQTSALMQKKKRNPGISGISPDFPEFQDFPKNKQVGRSEASPYFRALVAPRVFRFSRPGGPIPPAPFQRQIAVALRSVGRIRSAKLFPAGPGRRLARCPCGELVLVPGWGEWRGMRNYWLGGSVDGEGRR